MFRRNVLIFHTGALGDFLITWPMAMGLGRLYPQSRIIYVTQSQKGHLAQQALGVDWTDVEAGWHHLYANHADLPERSRKLLDGARTIISLVSTPDDPWTAHMRQIAPHADLHVLRPTPPEGYGQHASQHILDQITDMPMAEAMRQMLRSIDQRGLGKAVSLSGDVIIHPGSGGPAKCWPLQNFVDLAGRIAGTGRVVRFVIGETEVERWPLSELDRLHSVGEIRRPATYVDLLRELAAGSTYIGNDSGPSHLAGMLGLRTYCIFGPTDPAVWQPLGPRVRTIRRQPLAGLGVDEIFAWMNERLSVG